MKRHNFGPISKLQTKTGESQRVFFYNIFENSTIIYLNDKYLNKLFERIYWSVIEVELSHIRIHMCWTMGNIWPKKGNPLEKIVWTR